MRTLVTMGQARGSGARGRAAFTMVEVAIALGVIAIALVAILGVLPAGLRVQQENREDTILNQDGLLLIEAIRAGRDVQDRRDPVGTRAADWPNSLDYLTNHVVAVAVTNEVDGAVMYVNPFLVPPGGRVLPFGRLRGNHQTLRVLTNGLHVVGLLSRPRLEARPDGALVTNYVAALVRSISGPASDQGTVGRELAMTYVVTSELSPLGNFPATWMDYTEPGLTLDEVLVRSNRFLRVLNQGANFSELRLILSGPAYERRSATDARWQSFRDPKVYRTVLSGRHFSYAVQNDPAFGVYYVLPDGYRRLTP
jgi:type II secretory pathway pseudopilin PulG